MGLIPTESQCVQSQIEPYSNQDWFAESENAMRLECSQTRAIVVSSLVMMALLVVLVVPMLVLTNRIRVLVWRDDKLVPLMMACLTLSLVQWLVYFSFVIYQ